MRPRELRAQPAQRAQRARRTLGMTAASVLVVSTLLASCASAPASHHATAARKKEATPVLAHPVGPPAGTQAEAEQFGQQLLATIILPAGAWPMRPQLQPSYLARYAGNDLEASPGVEEFRLYRLPMSMLAAIAFVQAHLPSGVISSSQFWGKMLGAGDSTAEEYVGAQERTVPAGIDTAELEYAVVPGPARHSAVLRVTAQVIWYPPRPAAEDFTAASFREVKLVDNIGHGRIITKTLTSRQVIAQLVSLLDALHVSTRPASTCGLLGTDGSGLELLSASKGQPNVHAFYGCPGYSIYLGAKAEPALQPGYPSDKLWALITRLLVPPS